MAWYKFVNPKPADTLFTASRFYIESSDKDVMLAKVKNFGASPEWFDSEVEASEVPGPESTCSLNEKFKLEGHMDCYVVPLVDSSYYTHRWSHDGFVISGYGFTYDVDENSVSDVHATNPDGRVFSGVSTFGFVAPGFDLSRYQNDITTVTVGEFDEGIKFLKTIHRSAEDGFPPSVHYTFWAEDQEIIEERHERLYLVVDQLEDLKETRDEILEGFC